MHYLVAVKELMTFSVTHIQKSRKLEGKHVFTGLHMKMVKPKFAVFTQMGQFVCLAGGSSMAELTQRN